MASSKILVVDDDARVVSLLSQALQSLGYGIAGLVDSGEEAIAQTGQTKPDLVLMDILLGGNTDGVGAAEQIRNLYDTPVIFVTGYADQRTLERAKLCRPFGYLVKPVEERALYAAIELALFRHQMEKKVDTGDGWPAWILGSIPDAVISTDDKGEVVFMNPSAEAMTGWKKEEAIKKTLTDVFQIQSDNPNSLTESSRQMAYRDQGLLMSRNGSSVPIDYSATIIPEAKGKRAGYVVTFRNIAERKRIEDALRDSRKKYKDLVNSVEGIVWEAEVPEHRFSFVSKQAEKLLGYPLEQWVKNANFWRDALHPEDAASTIAFSQNAISQRRDHMLEYRMVSASGQDIWIRDNITVTPEEGAIKLRGVMVDITELKSAEESLQRSNEELEKRVRERTAELSKAVKTLEEQISERKRAEEALRESEERYALSAKAANDGLWDWDLKSNEVYFSTRWKLMLGHTETDIGKSPEEWFRRVHPDDIEHLKANLATHFQGITPHFEHEHRVMHSERGFRWMLSRGMAVRNADGIVTRMAGSMSDINDRKVAEEQLLHDAFHDGLTGLPNRALFMDRLGLALNHSRRRVDYLFAVLFLDIDRFKVINDSLGHMRGDQLLIEVTHRLTTCLRPGDSVARLGGDEFCVLIDDVNDVSDATRVANRIQASMQEPFSVAGQEVFATVSVGIALSDKGYDRPEDLLRDADTAMYRAKALGKNRYEVFDKVMHARAVALLSLETDLRWAIERHEFQVHYQPIVALQNDKIVGFEALLRWQHPQRGLVMPSEIIPVAEETGLIVPIGLWVLTEACHQLRKWQEQFPSDPPISVSVNLSAKQFIQPNLVESIEDILRDTGLNPSCLKLELTESVVMDNPQAAAATLRRLRDLDVQLQIDDFGTGYSSLSYLARFPIDTLKIDRSFISRLSLAEENLEIVRAIVTLARNLRLDVTAEGVETKEQLEKLRALGCEHAQGFYWSQPVESKDAARLIGDRAKKPKAHRKGAESKKS